jgi:DNA-binding MarR family transcriptional regulator
MIPTSREICSCAALRQAARHVSRLYDEALVPVGLGLNQYSILSTLERHGPQIQHNLASLLVTDRSTIGHLLRPLEERGLVFLSTPKTDRRRRVVSLTSEGIALVKRARPLWVKAERQFQCVFGEEPARALRSMLNTITMADFGRA